MEDEKKKKKKRRENFLEGTWLGGRDEKGMNLNIFSLGPPENFLPKMVENYWGEFDLFINQNAHVHLYMGFCLVLWSSFFSSFFV